MVFTIYGHGGHLGHVTRIMFTNFHFLVPETFIQNFVQNGPVVSEKIWFEFLYVHDLGSSFIQTMMGRSPQCYIPSFVEIGPPVMVKKIFEGFLPYMGMAAILVM